MKKPITNVRVLRSRTIPIRADQPGGGENQCPNVARAPKDAKKLNLPQIHEDREQDAATSCPRPAPQPQGRKRKERQTESRRLDFDGLKEETIPAGELPEQVRWMQNLGGDDAQSASAEASRHSHNSHSQVSHSNRDGGSPLQLPSSNSFQELKLYLEPELKHDGHVEPPRKRAAKELRALLN